MTTPSQPHQQTDTRRVRFYRAYLADSHGRSLAPAPIKDWLVRAGALGFDRQPSRYYEPGDGWRVYTEVDQGHPPVRFRLNRTKLRHIPPAELHGHIDTTYLSQDEGLVEPWYAVAFEQQDQTQEGTIVAIATKGNIALNTHLRLYIQDKFPSEATNLKIDQLAHKNTLSRIANMREGSQIVIGIKPSLLEVIRKANMSLADAYQASYNVYPQRELTQVIKPFRDGRFDLAAAFRPVIDLLLGEEEHRSQVTILCIGGLFGTSNKTTTINLLSDDLSVDIEVASLDQTFTVLDQDSVYKDIEDAYTAMETAIQEASEVSIWPAHGDGTSVTSSELTPRQLSLSPLQ